MRFVPSLVRYLQKMHVFPIFFSIINISMRDRVLKFVALL